MTTYRVTLTDGQTFLMEANLIEASASISANFGDDEDSWQVTPFQTANASADGIYHEWWAAELVADYFADGAADCATVKKVEVAR